MFVRIGNTPRAYAWGSFTAIPELLGSEATDTPQAELWLGAHSGSPSRILDPSQTGGAADLESWIAADPGTALGRFAASGRLPFLLKILAAASPLSLQAHPTALQARAGFDRENALGVALDAANRNYKDAHPKPELIFALSSRFDALCGFRPIEQTRALVEALIDAAMAQEDPQPQPLEDLLGSLIGEEGALSTTFEWLIANGTGIPTLVSLVTALADGGVAGYAAEMETVSALALEYPGDPGIVISLLLNRVSLNAGEALYLPAGNIHAYLNGLGVELMAASDNVLRGGLTPKYIDVPELLGVLDFTPVPVPYLKPSLSEPGISVYEPDVPDFVLVRVAGEESAGAVSYELTGPGIAICTAGSQTITGSTGSIVLQRGECAYLTPDEARLEFTGTGTLFLATTGDGLGRGIRPSR